jgi:sporulation protein YlmC with PRC-barrel domain
MNIRPLMAAATLSVLCISAPALAGAKAKHAAYSVSSAEVKALNAGRSVKNDLLGKTIYNDKGEELGRIEDLIFSADRLRPYALVGTDGFESIAKHDVVLPLARLTATGDHIVLTGATKDDMRALPEFRAKNSGTY